jgi:hypothetical protein
MNVQPRDRSKLTRRQTRERVAGLVPADVDVVQSHDPFMVAEPLYVEALGCAGEPLSGLDRGAASIYTLGV